MISENMNAFEVRLPLPVKTYDIDFAGIVSNIVYVRWLEDLRCEMLTNYLPIEQQLEREFAPVILQTQIEYRKPIKISEKPLGRMWINKMKTLKWECRNHSEWNDCRYSRTNRVLCKLVERTSDSYPRRVFSSVF